jgi:hypothetical protein
MLHLSRCPTKLQVSTLIVTHKRALRRTVDQPLLLPRNTPENAVQTRKEEVSVQENPSSSAPSWPVKDWLKDPPILHVYWDLDNKRPQFAEEYPGLIDKLRSRLLSGGMLPMETNYKCIQAFANPNTCMEHDAELMNDLIMTVVEDDLRCTSCGRRCKSVADLSKHFKQLHEREHKKKLASGSQKRIRT